MGELGAASCAEVFSEGPGGNIDKGVQAGSQDQVIVQRGAQINNGRQQGDAQNGSKTAADLLQLFRCDHVGEHGGEGNAHQHIVEGDAGEEPGVQQPAGHHGDGDAAEQYRQTGGFSLRPFQQQTGGEAHRRADENGKKDHDRDHIQRYRAAGSRPRDQGVHREKDGDPHHVVQYGHGEQRVGDRPFGMELIDDGQGGGRCGGEGDPAKDKRQIHRHTGQGRDNAEGERNHGKGTQRLGQGGDHQGLAGMLQLAPDQLGAQHDAEGALHPHDDGFIPACAENALGHQSDRVRAQQHADDQPAQNGRHFDFCHQLSRREGKGQHGDPP